ncbi:MAG: hypothetical protein A2Z11_00040 [Candidatus Woykebacteria bacterium RBG_16_43_9]|uniref:Transcription elongation factor GreA/GreB C-terminal domain-containing protein n=1 Tax=Candidatus Woykebacteria bacterium RBG_16_43_9 TaxID=1802596 RepID=A0A1G1WBU6_9BACT|nr:MAG: hypothetical protein A2Z11_00040 [Candidatus Woykebacteria bacterium RBG_16_43_9]
MKEVGDSERASLLTDLQQLEAEREELESDLSRAQICCGSTQTIEVGSKVTFRNLETGEVRTLIVVSKNGMIVQGTISVESPVGEALLGHNAGDEFEAPTASEKKQRLRIEAIGEGEPG